MNAKTSTRKKKPVFTSPSPVSPLPPKNRSKPTPKTELPPQPIIDDEPSIEAIYATKLAESGLRVTDATALRFELLYPDAIAALGEAHFLRGYAFRIPYFDAAGEPTGFYRLRYLKLESFAGKVKKPPRYTQPAKAIAGVYLTPMKFSSLGWKEIFEDPSVTITITEGELKSIAACRAGFPTIGLGGVDSWRAAKRGVPFLPELESIAWSGRRVYLVFDSDLAANPNVARALGKLCAELTVRGARPASVYLPAEEGKKTGLDDFLVAGGDLAAAFESAEEYELSEELTRLNDEVAYLRENDAVVDLGTGQLMLREVFANGVYGNRTFTEVVAGPVPHVVRKSTAKEWLTWSHRFELQKLVYLPGAERITADGCYNAWPGWGVTPKRGDVKPWKELLDFLFGTDAEAVTARRWFERWVAYPIQHPGTKLYSAVVMWGEGQGTGKSLIGYTLRRIYGENASVISQSDLHAGHNAWAVRKQFVMGEEITGSDRLADTDRLKALITQESVMVNEKYKPQYRIDDTINYYFTAQRISSFYLEKHDRRFFVWEAPETPLAREFYNRYDAWVNSPEGPAALFDYLLKLDLNGFDPKAHAPVTKAKVEMVDSSKSDLAHTIDDLLANPDEYLARWSIGADLLQPSQLASLLAPESRYPVSLRTLGALMKSRHRAISNPVSKRFYIIRNLKHWKKASEKDIWYHWADAFDPDYDARIAAKKKKPSNRKSREAKSGAFWRKELKKY